MPKFPVIYVIGLFFALPQGNCDTSCGRVKVHIFEILEVDGNNNLKATTPGYVPVLGVGLVETNVLSTINGLRTFGSPVAKLKLVVAEKTSPGSAGGPIESVSNIDTFQDRDDISSFFPGMQDLVMLKLANPYPGFQYKPKLLDEFGDHKTVSCRNVTLYQSDGCSRITFLDRSVFYWDKDLLSYRRSSCGELFDSRQLRGNMGDNLYYYVGDNDELKKLSGVPVFCKGYLVALMPFDVCKSQNTGSKCCATVTVLESEYMWIFISSHYEVQVPRFKPEAYLSEAIPDRPPPKSDNGDNKEKPKKNRKKPDDDGEDAYWIKPAGGGKPRQPQPATSSVEPTTNATPRVIYSHQEAAACPTKFLLLFCFIVLFVAL